MQSKRKRDAGRRKSAIERHPDVKYAYIEACQGITHANSKAAENERKTERKIEIRSRKHTISSHIEHACLADKYVG